VAIWVWDNLESKMTIVKYSEGEIIGTVSDGKETDDEKAKKALKQAQQAAKNTNKDGNNSSFNKESD
jgi:acyl-CoA reductase-like NAD-dependent aldehyde dehydrogenase